MSSMSLIKKHLSQFSNSPVLAQFCMLATIPNRLCCSYSYEVDMFVCAEIRLHRLKPSKNSCVAARSKATLNV